MSRPFSNRMFPDVVTFTPQSYAVGAHGGPTPVPGTPITLSCYVEVTTNPMNREEVAGAAMGGGVVTEMTLASLFFPDPGTGSPPVASGTDSVFAWTSSQGKTFAVPRTLMAKGPPDRQGELWVVNCREVV